jgi:D-alanyl-lipoteichoic acid acyltransferase DltB (MBOAT superfamily)
MLFNSPEFILGYLPLTLGGFFLAGRLYGTRAALAWLLVADLVFYGWWNPRYLPLLVGSVTVNYGLGRHIHRLTRASRTRAARGWLISGVSFNLGVLGWFKYADFLLHAAAPQAPALGIVLPLAISFFTFQQIMFLVDIFRAGVGRAGVGRAGMDREGAGPVGAEPASRPAVSALSYAAFVCFFPHLIAGPIVRPADILPQLEASRLARPVAANLAAGLTIFLLGLGKKLVLADTFGSFADTGFAAASHGTVLTLIEAWYAVLAYALQIYFDFSGYSDMAIGLARMANVRFPLNFDSPYKARDIADFWRRWHISLSRFLRDYLYIPLGGNRQGEVRRGVNLMLTMLLGGLWHGAAWTFIAWGGLHGLYLIVHRLWAGMGGRLGLRLPGPLAQALTLLAVVVAWVPFRADGVAATIGMLRGMAGLNGFALPRMIVGAWPALAEIARPVPVLLSLGDAHTLSLPEVSACLLLGWLIVLTLPHVHELSERARGWALTAGLAFTAQALFFAPYAAPFLYFRF